MTPPSRSTALDWPLSRSEKKSHVLELYDKDVQAANSMLRSGESALQALQQELQTIKNAHSDPLSGQGAVDGVCHGPDVEEPTLLMTPRQCPPVGESQMQPTGKQSRHQPGASAGEKSKAAARRRLVQGGDADPGEAAQRLQQAIADATDALSALLGAAALQQAEEEDVRTSDEDSTRPPLRARSEGAERLAPVLHGGLRRGRVRRLSRGGQPLRVSFSECTDKATGFKCDGEMDLEEPGSPRSVSSLEPNNEPEPSPEDPLTPERQPFENLSLRQRKLEASPREHENTGKIALQERSPLQQAWQRTPPAHQRHGSGSPDLMLIPFDDTGSGRSRRRERDRRGKRGIGSTVAIRPQPHGGRLQASEERAIVLAGKRDSPTSAPLATAPATAMDFL